MKIINELFRLSGLNQKQFSEKHKVSESLFCKYLSGKAVPRKSTLDRIATKEGYFIKETLIDIEEYLLKDYAKEKSEEFINNQKTK